MTPSLITEASREMIRTAALKQARNRAYARANQQFPPLRSFRPSCDARRLTWTADSSARGVDEIAGIPMVTPSDQPPSYADLEELYPETVKRLGIDE